MEKNLKKSKEVYKWFTLLHNKNQHNIVSQLYSNKKWFLKIQKKKDIHHL